MKAQAIAVLQGLLPVIIDELLDGVLCDAPQSDCDNFTFRVIQVGRWQSLQSTQPQLSGDQSVTEQDREVDQIVIHERLDFIFLGIAVAREIDGDTEYDGFIIFVFIIYLLFASFAELTSRLIPSLPLSHSAWTIFCRVCSPAASASFAA